MATIQSVSPAYAGDTVTITVDAYSSVGSVTYNGVALTSVVAATATTITATMPRGGQAFGSSNNFIVTDAGTPSAAFAALFQPPQGFDYETLGTLSAGSPFNTADYSEATAGDQIAYSQTSSPSGYPVAISAEGVVVLDGTAASTQTLSFYFLDASDTYSAQASNQTLTITPDDSMFPDRIYVLDSHVRLEPTEYLTAPIAAPVSFADGFAMALRVESLATGAETSPHLFTLGRRASGKSALLAQFVSAGLDFRGYEDGASVVYKRFIDGPLPGRMVDGNVHTLILTISAGVASLYLDSGVALGTFAASGLLSPATDITLNGLMYDGAVTALGCDVRLHYAYLYSSLSAAEITDLMAGAHPASVGTINQGYDIAGDGSERNAGTALTETGTPIYDSAWIEAPTATPDPTSMWSQIGAVGDLHFQATEPTGSNAWIAPHTEWTTANAILPLGDVISGSNAVLTADIIGADGAVRQADFNTVAGSVVSDLAASVLSSTEVSISWTGQGDFTYNPRYRIIGAGSWTTLPSAYRVDDGPLTVTVSGLTAAVDYEFDLTAADASSNLATATTAPSTGIVDIPSGGFGGGATFELPLYIDHTVITAVTYDGDPITYTAEAGVLTITIPSGLGIDTYDLVIVTESQSFTYPVIYVQLTPFVATAKLTTVAADGRYPGLPFRVRAIQASAQVAIDDLAVTTTDTTATLTFTPIQGATQYLYQRAVGTSWGGDTYASTATGTFQFTGLSSGTTYSFRIFVDGVVSNVIVKATTGTGGTAPTGNTGTGTQTTPGVALASQLTSIGTPGRNGSAVEPQWDIHMTAERLAVGAKATGSSLDSFFFADETYISDAFKVKGTRSFQCNYIHSRAYDSMGGNPGNNEHQGYLHWGGGKHFPSNKYVYGGGFIHVQFSVYVEPSYLWQTNATYQKIFRIGGRRNATTQDNSGWLTLVVKPDSSTDSMKVLVDNEINFNAMTEAGKSNAYVAVYPAEQVSPGSDRLIKGQWNTFEFAVYPEPNGTKAIFKLWKYNTATGLMERIHTNTNRTDFLVTKSGYYTSCFMLNVWNWNRYTRVGNTGGNFAQSGGTWIQTAPGAGTHNLATNAVASDQRMYFDEIKIHTSHADMNEFDNLGEKVIGWAR